MSADQGCDENLLQFVKEKFELTRVSHKYNKKYYILPFRRAGGCLNIKMPSYQYRDSHVKDKTV